MKKIILALFCCLIVGSRAIPQTLSDAGDALNWASGMASQINNVISTFKNSTRYIEIANEIQKVANLTEDVNRKYRSVRAMSYYASEREFISFFNEGMTMVDQHTNSSRDYVRIINQGIVIGEKLVSIIQGSGSAADVISGGVDLGATIASGGLSGLFGSGGLFGKKDEKPDPQKILDNLKANDDMLDKSYRELKDATAILTRLNDELETFENYDNHEKLLRQNSKFYVF